MQFGVQQHQNPSIGQQHHVPGMGGRKAKRPVDSGRNGLAVAPHHQKQLGAGHKLELAALVPNLFWHAISEDELRGMGPRFVGLPEVEKVILTGSASSRYGDWLDVSATSAFTKSIIILESYGVFNWLHHSATIACYLCSGC